MKNTHLSNHRQDYFGGIGEWDQNPCDLLGRANLPALPKLLNCFLDYQFSFRLQFGILHFNLRKLYCPKLYSTISGQHARESSSWLLCLLVDLEVALPAKEKFPAKELVKKLSPHLIA